MEKLNSKFLLIFFIIISVIGVIIFLNLFQNIYFLSDVNFVKKINKKIGIFVFYKNNTAIKKKIKKVIREIHSMNKRIRYQCYDPNIYSSKATAYGLDDYGVIIEGPYGFLRAYIPSNASEDALKRSIIETIRKAIQIHGKIYFLTGHGERNIKDTSNSGISKLYIYLKNRNFSVKELNFFKLGKVMIPMDTNLLVINRPIVDFIPEEHKIIKQYIDSGGNLLVFTDPMTKANINSLVASMDAKFYSGVVLDEISFSGHKDIPLIFFNNMKIPELKYRFSNFVYFPVAGSFVINENLMSNKIIKFSSSSFSYLDMDGDNKFNKNIDIMGPHNIGILIEGNRKLAFFGDSDFTSNENIDNYGNKIFCIYIFERLLNMDSDNRILLPIQKMNIKQLIGILFIISPLVFLFVLLALKKRNE